MENARLLDGNKKSSRKWRIAAAAVNGDKCAGLSKAISSHRVERDNIFMNMFYMFFMIC